MGTTEKTTEKHRLATDAALAGILALLIEERQDRRKNDETAEKIEVVLSKVGLTNEDIATVTGKQPTAVRKAISRAKPKKSTHQ